jgi:hypothetical protein
VRAVIDTNVLRVAARQHKDVSDDCVETCVKQLLLIQKDGVVFIDDDYRILGEYLRNPPLLKSNTVGGKFLKWLIQNQATNQRVVQVAITDIGANSFAEFPDADLQPKFDAPDRKFVAVANAHPHKPVILQAADSKWLDWWQALQKKGVEVDFLCPADACRFYQKKFPSKQIPALPGRGK